MTLLQKILTSVSFRARYLLVILYGVFAATSFASASITNGTIDPAFKFAKVCHSALCVTPAPGLINFAPTGTTAVSINDTAISGIAWGNELGWITLNPTGPEGLVVNPSSGIISGKAWSQVGGWINFAPTGQSVSINNNGEFVGWAWVGGPYGGWIKFDCADTSACIKTDWRVIGLRPVNGPVVGGGGNGPVDGSAAGGGSPSDLCWNMGGIQYDVPNGYVRTGNSCDLIDVCQNVPGAQSVVPSGYTQDQGGLCYLAVDYCPNLSEIQYTVPAGYVVSGSGQCLESGLDYCPNTPGVQARGDVCAPAPKRPIVTGVTEVTNDGVTVSKRRPQTTIAPIDEFAPITLVDEDSENSDQNSSGTADQCPNLAGDQVDIPEGYTTDYLGACVPAVTDYCPNIDGEQTEIPEGYEVTDSGACMLGTLRPQETELSDASNGDGTGGMLSFTFVPAALRIPITSPALTSVVRFFTGGKEQTLLTSDTNAAEGTSRVDVVGLLLTTMLASGVAAGMGYGLWALMALFFRRKWGKVFDVETGAVLEGARLLLYNQSGELVAETDADKRGLYGFKVPAGEYSIRAVLPLFQQAPQSGADLYSGGIVSVGKRGRITLHIGMRHVAPAVAQFTSPATPVPPPAPLIPPQGGETQ